MRFLIGGVAASMIAAGIMSGSIVTSAADTVPNFDVEPSCSAAARQAGSPDYLSICRSTEQKARDELVRQWPQINRVDKTQCIPTATIGGKPTYTELLTCIELTRDVRRLRSKPESTTTGQRAR